MTVLRNGAPFTSANRRLPGVKKMSQLGNTPTVNLGVPLKPCDPAKIWSELILGLSQKKVKTWSSITKYFSSYTNLNSKSNSSKINTLEEIEEFKLLLELQYTRKNINNLIQVKQSSIIIENIFLLAEGRKCKKLEDHLCSMLEININ